MASDERPLAIAAYKRGEQRQAVDLCESGIDRAQAQRNHEECWHLRILLSQCLCFLGDFAKSLAVFEATPITEDVSVETRARVLNQKPFGLSRSGDFAEAKEALSDQREFTCSYCRDRDQSFYSLLLSLQIRRSGSLRAYSAGNRRKPEISNGRGQRVRERGQEPYVP